jgi:hypothetical protein
MSRHPENLVAWLDDELPQREAQAVEEHVRSCGECRARAAAYAELGQELAELGIPRVAPRRHWPVFAGVAAAAAAALIAIVLWPRQAPTQVVADLGPAPVVIAPQKTLERPARVAAPVRRKVKRRIEQAPQPARRPEYNGPVIRVALPADQLFAPGALPAGTEIYADLTLAADGTARELRLLP